MVPNSVMRAKPDWLLLTPSFERTLVAKHNAKRDTAQAKFDKELRRIKVWYAAAKAKEQRHILEVANNYRAKHKSVRTDISSSARTTPVQALVSSKIKEIEQSVSNLKAQRDNPSVRDLYHSRLGALEALKAVEAAFKNNLTDLRIL